MAKINNKFYTIKGSNGIEKLSLYTTLEEVNGKGKALKLPVVGKVYYAIGDVNDPNATKKRLKIDGKVYAGLREAITKKIYTKYYIFEPGKHDLYIPNNAKKVTYYMYGGGSGMIVTQDPILMNPNTGDITVSAADADWFDRALYFANQKVTGDGNFELFTNGQSSTIVDADGVEVAKSNGIELFVDRYDAAYDKYKDVYANTMKFNYDQYIDTKLTPSLQSNNEYTLDEATLPIAVYNTKIREEFPRRVASPGVKTRFNSVYGRILARYEGGGRGKVPIIMEDGYRIWVYSKNSSDGPGMFNEAIPAQYTPQDCNMPLVYNRYLNIIKLPANLKKETTVYGKNISTKEYLANSIRKAIEDRTRCYIKYIPNYNDFPSDIREYMERTDIAGKIAANSSYTNALADKLLDYNPPYESYSDFRLLCRYYLEPDYRRDINTINSKDSKYKLFTQNIYNKAIHTDKFFSDVIDNMLPSLGIKVPNPKLRHAGRIDTDYTGKDFYLIDGVHVPVDEVNKKVDANKESLTEGMIDIFGRSNLNIVDSEEMTTPHDTYKIKLDYFLSDHSLLKYADPNDARTLLIKSPFLRMNHTYYTNSVTELCKIDSNDTRCNYDTDLFSNTYATMNEPLCGCITGAKVKRATGDIDLEKYKGKILTFNIGKGGTLFFNTSNKFMGYWRVDDIADRFCLDNDGMAIVKMELEEFKSMDAVMGNKIDAFITPVKANDNDTLTFSINTVFMDTIPERNRNMISNDERPHL